MAAARMSSSGMMSLTAMRRAILTFGVRQRALDGALHIRRRDRVRVRFQLRCGEGDCSPQQLGEHDTALRRCLHAVPKQGLAALALPDALDIGSDAGESEAGQWRQASEVIDRALNRHIPAPRALRRSTEGIAIPEEIDRA